MKKSVLIIALIAGLLVNATAFAQDGSFTQEDRERLIRLETTLQVFMEQVDKRFEQVDARFAELREDMNKRFELMNKRFVELREDMNKRFEQVDKRFEQIDRRFEQVDKRFEQLINFLWMLVAIFTTLTGVVIGFAYWDRRTIIRKARDEAIETIERQGRLADVIQALRKIAAEDKKVAEVLRSFGLL